MATQMLTRTLIILCMALLLPSLVSAQPAAPAASCVFDSYLARGMRNTASESQIIRLQTFLAAKFNVAPGDVVTGYFGPTTERLVKQYQQGSGIEQTGGVGPKTRAALAKECAAAAKPVTLSATSPSGACPAPVLPACPAGTLMYQGRDARGCAKDFMCGSFRFAASSTPVVYLPDESTRAPDEFVSVATMIFTKFPTGSAGDRGQFVMGEPSSVYVELDAARKLCLRVISALDGNKDICNPVSLDTTYHLELSAVSKNVRLLLNDALVASTTVRHDLPKGPFRVGSRAADAKGFMGPLLGSLQRVQLVATTTVPTVIYAQSYYYAPSPPPAPSPAPAPSGPTCPAVVPAVPHCPSGVAEPVYANGCITGYACQPIACPIVPVPLCAEGSIPGAVVRSDGCVVQYTCNQLVN